MHHSYYYFISFITNPQASIELILYISISQMLSQIMIIFVTL